MLDAYEVIHFSVLAVRSIDRCKSLFRLVPSAGVLYHRPRYCSRCSDMGGAPAKMLSLFLTALLK